MKIDKPVLAEAMSERLDSATPQASADEETSKAQDFSPTLVGLEGGTRKAKAGQTADPSGKSIEDLQIGTKLRHARLLQKLRLKDLADRIGCSESLLSKVENEQVKPSLKILHRLAAELNMSIGVLFSGSDNSQRIVTKKSERPVIQTNTVGRPASNGVRLECLVPDPSNKLLFGSIHVVEPGAGSVGTIEHKGEEIGYVLEGELELTVDGTTYQLSTGDSFFFDSSLPHGYVNKGDVTARIIWINTPSTF